MNSYIKLYAKPFYPKEVCSNHYVQINPLHVPALKACANCGQSEPLSGNEIYWPSNPADKISPSEGRISMFNRSAYLALIVGALVLIKLNHSATSDFFPSHLDRITQAVTTGFHSIPNLQSDTLSEVGGANVFARPQKHQKEETPVSSPDGVAKFSGPARLSVESTAVDQEVQSNIPARQVSVQGTYQPDGDEIYREPADTAQGAGGIETKITKAITNRAVFGVTVSFEKNTAFLAGLVKTENQKSAAEQAALSVPEVKRIKSSIHVEWVGG